MAVKIALANGNWLTAGTWATVDATSVLDSEAGTTVLTTAYVASSTFAPGAITIDGIAVKVAARAAVPSGTFSIRLAIGGVLVAGTEVTINVSDVDARNAEQGWYFFKFAAPVLLLAATNYTLDAKTSVASQITLYRNATAANYSRLLRTDATGAPGAGDHAHIMGEWTAAATMTARTVTMNETATTDYGDNNKTNPPGITVNKGGTLTWGTTAATNYILRVSCQVAIYTSGVMTIGTTGTPMPRDSTAQLQFNCDVADGDFGLRVFGTLTLQGLSRTDLKNVVACRLNTDEAAGQTVLGVDTDTGWKSGDEIALSGTTRTATDAEIRILNGDAAASTVTVTVATANARSGTSPTQAHVLLLTRNVMILSTSTTLMGYVYTGPAAICDWDWAGFRYLGAATGGRRGVEIDGTSAGNFNANFCSAFQFDQWGFNVVNAAADNITITNFTGFSIGVASSTQGGITIAATTGTAITVTDCWVIGDNTTAPAFFFLDGAGTYARLYGMNSSIGFHLDDATARSVIDTLECYGNQGPNINLVAAAVMRWSNVKWWRSNATGGLQIAEAHDVEIATMEAFGNATNNLMFTTAAATIGRMLFRSGVFSGDSTFSTASGVDFGNSVKGFPSIVFENCTFGVVSGIKTAHTQDVQFGTSRRFIDIVFVDSTLASGSEFANSASLVGRSAIHRQRLDGTTNTHNSLYPALGTVAYDATVFNTAAPSQKLTPSGATAPFRLRSGLVQVPVENATQKIVNVFVRKDGSYAGSTVRLILLANPAMGLDTDTVLDSMTAGASVWEQLTGTTPVSTEAGVWTLCIEVDGSAGNVWVDDWSAAAA